MRRPSCAKASVSPSAPRSSPTSLPAARCTCWSTAVWPAARTSRSSPGASRFVLPVEPLSNGHHVLRVQLQTGQDTLAQNNSAGLATSSSRVRPESWSSKARLVKASTSTDALRAMGLQVDVSHTRWRRAGWRRPVGLREHDPGRRARRQPAHRPHELVEELRARPRRRTAGGRWRQGLRPGRLRAHPARRHAARAHGPARQEPVDQRGADPGHGRLGLHGRRPRRRLEDGPVQGSRPGRGRTARRVRPDRHPGLRRSQPVDDPPHVRQRPDAHRGRDQPHAARWRHRDLPRLEGSVSRRWRRWTPRSNTSSC